MTEKSNSQDTEPKYTTCPCCGQPTLRQPVKPGQALTDHWMACMIAGVPFSHTYPLYAGRVEITVSMMTAETEKLVNALSAKLNVFEPDMSQSDAMQVDLPHMRAMLRMYALIDKIRIRTSMNDWKEFLPREVVHDVKSRVDSAARGDTPLARLEALDAAYDMLMSSSMLSSLPLDIIATVTEAHIQLNSIMMNAGFDQNFWAGIELA